MPTSHPRRFSSAALAALAALAASLAVGGARAEPAPAPAPVAPRTVAMKAELRFARLALEDGLPQMHVTAIVQDRIGFLWFGTEEGLVRYDGQRMKVFGVDPLPSAYVTALAVDAEGQIWVGTHDGLVIYDPRGDRFVTRGLGEITSIRADGPWVWVGLSSGQLQRHAPRGGERGTFLRSDGIQSSITAIAPDGAGGVWVGTEGSGVYRIDREGAIVGRLDATSGGAASLAADRISAVHVDRAGALWIGTEETGVDRYDVARKEVRHHRAGPGAGDLTDDRVNFLLEDSDQGLWVGTKGGLNLIRPGRARIEHYLPDPERRDSLPNPWIACGFLDRERTLWFGTYGGIGRVDQLGRQFDYLHTPDASAALYEQSADVLWIGTHPGALIRFDRAAQQAVIHRRLQLDTGGEFDLGKYWVTQIARAGGALWVGGLGFGLLRFDPATGLAHHFTELFGDGETRGIFHIAPAADGGLWLATFGAGLVKFDPRSERFEHWEAGGRDGLPSAYLYAVLPDRRDPTILWVGSAKGGLARLDLTRKTVAVHRHDASNKESISNDDVTTLYQGEDGNIWLGTYGGGFCRFDPASDKARCFGRELGIPSSTVYGILGDAAGRLWMSTNGGGLVRFDPRTEKAVIFDADSGAMGEYSQASFHQGKSGRLYFGSPSGIVGFDPAGLKPDDSAPPLVMTSLRVLNEEAELDRPIWFGPPIELGYHQRMLSFEFAALSYVAPRRIRFQYKIEGLHEGWIDAQGPYVPLGGIDDGRYVFRVRAANRHGVWNEAGLRVPFAIATPIWRTWWAYALYALAVAAAVALFVRYQTRRVARLEHLNRLASMERDLALTAVVQSGFLPPSNFFEGARVRLFGFYRPAGTCSGDWWWHEQPGGGKHSILVGDVTGHGPGPAMVTAAVATAYRVQSTVGLLTIDQKMAVLNDEVLKVGAGHYHMTMSALELDESTGLFTYHGAGGLPMITLSAAGEVHTVFARGTPLGSRSFVMNRVEGQLERSDRLLIYTDGIPELSLPSGRAMGMRRLSQLFAETRPLDLPEAAERIVRESDTMLAGRQQDDDWTFAIVEWS